MELSEIIPHIEALIFASDRPLTNLDLVDLINNAFGFMEEQITLDQVETALEGIREKYSSDFYPFEVFQSGGGWQFLSKPAFHTTIAQLNGGKFLKKLSNAAMETLSIIAYKQPITKGEIESIRGVNSDYSVQKLLEKELIVISGRNEELPGKPLIYETSKSFMDYFGLNTTSDLPKIKEVLAEQIEPTQQQRVTEENADFGIFRKFDEEPETTGTTTDTNSNLPADEDAIGDLELAAEEHREAVLEATEDLEVALHPDLSHLQPSAIHSENAEEVEGIDGDIDEGIDGDGELADLEADDVLSGTPEEEPNEEDLVEEEDEDSSEAAEEEDDNEEDEDEDEDDGEDEDEDEGDDEDDDEDDDDDDEDDDDEDEDDEDEDEDAKHK